MFESTYYLSRAVRVKILSDLKLHTKVVFAYDAVSVSGRACWDGKSRDSANLFVNDGHGTLLPKSFVVRTSSLKTTLLLIGGIQTLFPLFASLGQLSQVALGSEEPNPEYSPESNTAVAMIEVLTTLLGSDLRYLNEFVEHRGCLILGYVFEQLPSKYLTTKLFDAMKRLGRCLGVFDLADSDMRRQCFFDFYNYIFLNRQLCLKASVAVQKELFGYVASQSTLLRPMRELLGTQFFLDILVDYSYSMRLGEGRDPAIINAGDLSVLRAYFLLLLKAMVNAGEDSSLTAGELRQWLNHVNGANCADDVADVYTFLYLLLVEQPASIFEEFLKLDGLKIVLGLFQYQHDVINLHSLKILSLLYTKTSSKLKTKVLAEMDSCAFAFITNALANRPTKTDLYNAFLEWIIEQPLETMRDVPCDLEPAFRLVNPQALQALLNVVASTIDSEQTVCVLLLRGLCGMLEASDDNIRSFLSMRDWQRILFRFLEYAGAPTSVPASPSSVDVRALALKMIRIVYFYLIVNVKDGWIAYLELVLLCEKKLERQLLTNSARNGLLQEFIGIINRLVFDEKPKAVRANAH